MNIKTLIQTEITNLSTNEQYWGTEENINNENKIFDYMLTRDIVTQDWFDDKLNYTNVERLQALLNRFNERKILMERAIQAFGTSS